MALTAAAVAVNVAVLCPLATVTLAGTVTLPLLLESTTVVADDAGAASATVQDDVPGAFTEPGEQLRLLS